jgi:serine/threonine-protein kinase RsbT
MSVELLPHMETTIPIERDADIVTARQVGRELAATIGFAKTDQTLIATAISEVARNILVYAKRGEILLRVLDEGSGRGILVEARDKGPGIADVTLAMRDGYSTVKSLGLGLPGARRLMDDLQVHTELGIGTTVRMKKWVR